MSSWAGLASSLGTAAGMVTARTTHATSSPALSAVMVTAAGIASLAQPAADPVLELLSLLRPRRFSLPIWSILRRRDIGTEGDNPQSIGGVGTTLLITPLNGPMPGPWPERA